ncbi:MAG: hypothetical protein IE925_10090 [Rhodobacterales bacterium]|nr:hypothetical protein [Rhodobacterales bacterium]
MADMIVSTFQRGGSSLVMQMLYAGGLDCAGSAPDFEDGRAMLRRESGNDAQWISGEDGAVKLLEPQRFKTGQRVALSAIWLDRDPMARARSAVRFMASKGVPIAAARQSMRAFASSYVHDRKMALHHLAGLCAGNVMALTFEELVQDPRKAARMIAGLIPHRGLDQAAMASVAIPRPAGLAPEMLEPRLLQLWASGRMAVPAGRIGSAHA